MLAHPLALAGFALPLLFAAGPARAAPQASAQEPIVPQERQYRAVRTHEAMVIDGKANETTWQRTPIDDRFVERQPELGAKPPVRTTLRVAYDDFAMYVFIEAFSDPGDIIVRTLRRDNTGIFADDEVVLKIDPNRDRRTAYSLGVNADGAQIDTLSLEDGRVFIREWDAVWQAETQKHRNGYTIEYKIPFAILGVKRADERTMGFEVTRDHPSRNATYDWKLIVPPRSPTASSQFGQLTGLRNLKSQRAIEFTPFVLGRTDFKADFSLDPARRPNFATGGDLRIQVGASSYVEGSILTDFAQVEADEVQVARDRFPLFFPERRPFFINGLDVFNFGRQREAQLFFSRRIGLVNGRAVPIAGGLKVYGRAGIVSYGLLQVQTLSAPADPARDLPAQEPDNVTVGRVRVQATDQLNVGAMVLGQHRFNTANEDNAAGGIDAQVIGLGGKLQWYGFLAGTWAQDPAQRATFDEQGTVVDPELPETSAIGSSAHSFLEYRGLFVRPSLLWLWSDEDFDPRLGFYRRPGTARQEGNLRFAPRPRALGLRDVQFGPRYSLTTDPAYTQRLTQEAAAVTELNWRNGSQGRYQVTHFIDDVQQPFTLYDFEVQAKRYSGLRHRFSGQSPQRRAFQVSPSYEFADLFGGIVHQPSLGITGRFGKHFTITGRYTHLVGHLEDPDNTFNFGFANGNIDIAINRNLAFDTIARVDFSPGRERVGFQGRFRWRFLPGSDLFVVYRNDIPVGSDPPGEPPRTQFHELTVKATFYLRALVGR